MPKTFELEQDDVATLSRILAATRADFGFRPGARPQLMFDAVSTLTVHNDELAAHIADILRQPDWRDTGLKMQLKAHAADVRWRKEISGIGFGGIVMPTDRDTQHRLATIAAHIHPSATIHWKLPNGTFTSFNGNGLKVCMTAIIQHVQRCFAAEHDVITRIERGDITTTAEIDAAFATV